MAVSFDEKIDNCPGLRICHRAASIDSVIGPSYVDRVFMGNFVHSVSLSN